MSVITEKGDITTSYLLIQRARSSDSGKYICLPSNANSQTINVHVLNGKYDDEVNRNVRQQFLAHFVLAFSREQQNQFRLC